jgi:hypothetical protein
VFLKFKVTQLTQELSLYETKKLIMYILSAQNLYGSCNVGIKISKFFYKPQVYAASIYIGSDSL